MTSTVHQEIILPDVKRNIMNMIEREALDNDGIIFGGAVRDAMISEEYAHRYRRHLQANKERYNSKKFWNTRVHPETAARTLVPRDIDIFFDYNKKNNMDRFISALQEMCNAEHINMDIERSEDDPANANRYGRMLNVQKITLTMLVGRIPFMFRGYEIVIDVDIVIPNYSIMMQPPFCNLDFLCNGFIKTKHGVMYSTDTGTYMDTLTNMERTVEVLKIQQDMMDFKTNFCRYEKIKARDISTFGKNAYALKRIQKLLGKEEFPWTICNLPFELTQTTDQDLTTECTICCCQFQLKETLAITTTLKDEKEIRTSVTHTDCLMKYLVHQDHKAAHVDFLVDRDEFVFKCPMRTVIDFTKCSCEYKNAASAAAKAQIPKDEKAL